MPWRTWRESRTGKERLELATRDHWNERNRTLPAGLTCAQCMSMVFCADKFDRTPEDTTCARDPGRFRVRVELYQDAVAGLAACREALGRVAGTLCTGYCEGHTKHGCKGWADVSACTVLGKDLALLLASPDPGQAILARLKAGEELRKALLAAEAAHDRWACMLHVNPDRASARRAWHTADKELKDAEVAFDKAVTP